MALPVIQSVQFNLSSNPPQVRIADLTDYAGLGLNPALALANCYMESPAGVFHNNTSWVAPDIDGSVSNYFYHNLPLDPSTGAVLAGTYNFVLTVNYHGGKEGGTVSDTFNYCFVAPVPVIELTDTCMTSTLISEDVTNYSVNFNGTITAPTTAVRVHTVKYPIDPLTGLAVHADVVSSDPKLTITPIWTQSFTTLLAVDLLYESVDGMFVNYTMGGTDTVEVLCDDTICCLYDCIWNAYNKYLEAKCSNPSNADRYQTIMIKALSLWMLYSIAANCGEVQEMQDRLNDIKTLLDATECNCCSGVGDGVPVQVIPVFGGSGTTGSYNVLSAGDGIVVTTNIIGGTTNFTLSIDEATIACTWSNVTGTPTTLVGYGITNAYTKAQVDAFFTSFSGGLGQVTWTNVLSKPQLNQILINDTTAKGSTFGVGAWEDYQVYAMPGATLSTKGDMLEFETILTFSAVAGIKSYRMYWGATAIIDDTYIGAGQMHLKLTVSRTTTGTQFIEWERTILGSPSVVTKGNFTTAAENLANPINLKVSGLSGMGVLNEIVSQYIRVKAFIK